MSDFDDAVEVVIQALLDQAAPGNLITSMVCLVATSNATEAGPTVYEATKGGFHEVIGLLEITKARKLQALNND